jgi:hypothetical protein
MTLSTYSALITARINSSNPGVTYPDSYREDVEVCFQQRLSVDAAATKLVRDWDLHGESPSGGGRRKPRHHSKAD